jgi:allophanate hydrolase subunit 2
MVPGCVQVPPNGQPIVMLGDGPTTGGYPKIATVLSADLGRLAQLVAGDAVRFRLVTIEDAQRTPSSEG